MRQKGYFTASDHEIILRAAFLAEGLTQAYFSLEQDVWKRNPYNVFTRREVGKTLCQEDAFANVIRMENSGGQSSTEQKRVRYGIVLHDPNILLAMLRRAGQDLWTLGLFIFTHELVHIVRFRDYGVDFFATQAERDGEEKKVQAVTREILSGAANMDRILELYNSPIVNNLIGE